MYWIVISWHTYSWSFAFSTIEARDERAFDAAQGTRAREWGVQCSCRRMFEKLPRSSMYRARTPRERSFPARTTRCDTRDVARRRFVLVGTTGSKVETERTWSTRRQGGRVLIGASDFCRIVANRNCRSTALWRWTYRTRQSARASSSSITRCSMTRRKGRTS